MIFLNGVDPVGVPFLRAGVLEREVWEAITIRAARIMKSARSS